MSTDPTVKSGYTFVLTAATVSVAGTLDCNGTADANELLLDGDSCHGRNQWPRTFANSARARFSSQTGAAPTEAQMAPGGGGTPIQ